MIVIIILYSDTSLSLWKHFSWLQVNLSTSSPHGYCNKSLAGNSSEVCGFQTAQLTLRRFFADSLFLFFQISGEFHQESHQPSIAWKGEEIRPPEWTFCCSSWIWVVHRISSCHQLQTCWNSNSAPILGRTRFVRGYPGVIFESIRLKGCPHRWSPIRERLTKSSFWIQTWERGWIVTIIKTK